MGSKALFRFLPIVVVLALILGLSSTAFSQAGTGQLTGVVSDPTGAVVSKLVITLTNTSTNLTYTTETTTSGSYRFGALPIVGSYNLEINAPNFKKILISNIVLSVGTVVTKDITLEVGVSKEVITVEAGAQTVETNDSSVSQLVGQRVWEEMPLSVRNQNSFIELVAGAVPDAQGGSTRGASVNGARGGAGNYMVEGMDNNDQGQGGRGQLSGYDAGGAVTSISPEAIQEYRVITNSFAAEYGKAGGFVTDTVLKSGTNKWHGSLFEYNRVQALAANRFFSNRTPDPERPGQHIQDQMVRNQFGGSIGGPVIKDKAFFYYSTEYHKAREAGTLSGYGTTKAFLDFVKSNLSVDQLKGLMGVRVLSDGRVLYFDPSILDTTGKAVAPDSQLNAPSTTFNQVFFHPGAGQVGNMGRLQFDGPAVLSWDMAFRKDTKITERFTTQFSAEMINFPNHNSFQTGGATFDWDVNSTTFGQLNSSAISGRIVQLGLRLKF